MSESGSEFVPKDYFTVVSDGVVQASRGYVNRQMYIMDPEYREQYDMGIISPQKLAEREQKKHEKTVQITDYFKGVTVKTERLYDSFDQAFPTLLTQAASAVNVNASRLMQFHDTLADIATYSFETTTEHEIGWLLKYTHAKAFHNFLGSLLSSYLDEQG